MFRVPREEPGFYRKFSPKFGTDQISQAPSPGDFYSLMNWIQTNTVPIPPEWEPYYRFMHGPLMGIPTNVSLRPSNLQEFDQLMRIYGAIQSMEQTHRNQTKFLDMLAKAYGLSSNRISPDSGKGGFWKRGMWDSYF